MQLGPDYVDWKYPTIFFSAMVTTLVFLPPLIYSYTKNVLNDILPLPEIEASALDNDKRAILRYYFTTDQIVFCWVIFIFFSLFCGIFRLAEGPGSLPHIQICWLVFSILILAVSIATWFSKERLSLWGFGIGRFWITFVAIYSLVPIASVLSFNGIWADDFVMNFDDVALFMLAISIGYYILWWASSLLSRPMQTLIGMRGAQGKPCDGKEVKET
jgi:hypothetical protein